MTLFIYIFLSLFLIDNPVYTADELINDLACGNCHTGIQTNPGIIKKAPDLNLVSVKYPADFIANYLQNPVKIQKDIGASRMPDFNLSGEEAAAVTLYLSSRVPDSLSEVKTNFSASLQKLIESFPNITIEKGQKVFQALNCQACHISEITSADTKNAPDLSIEGSRVKEAWLRSFLSDPQAVRPFGYLPGSGSRMPDFKLTDDEVNTLSSYLMKQQKRLPSATGYKVKVLSSFAKMKAEKLLKDKLSCLGCHQYQGTGGRIAPELAMAHERLQAGYVYAIINNPAHIADSLIMPRIKMPQDRFELIADFLNQQSTHKMTSSYLSLSENETIDFESSSATKRTYLKYCASCHGVSGKSDGFNSQYLFDNPTLFSDKAYMRRRPDDTLYDGIYGGAYILNKSNLMPPWGFTLSNNEIKNLVKYIRELCDCTPPVWSTH